ncbi:NAD(P)-dependent oxidoreductase [Paractinoplanes hotanensis]|uniref:NAD(P)-binding domain-containing protein n=1 Tax=Paractinoplanes hotanensis TaxID=2906497 RepID=A0ABT0YBJ5_9ACTN|nr:NAD(P)-dependent oxidoreductase [Actinoplanes hotanensis]MCM4083120.1 NAD(P)-binding domain-containing protein [Actinoplanes hotanensis]
MNGDLRICVFHPTMGRATASLIAAADPSATVDVVHDVDRDPPSPETIDVLIANRVPAGLLHRCERLAWLHLTGSGTDHVPAHEIPPGLRVTTSAEVPVRAVAEFTVGALLALGKQTHQLVDRQRRHEWSVPDATLLGGSHLVLLGLGRIGGAIARLAEPFGMRVTAVTRTAQPSAWADAVLPAARLADAVLDADHLVCAVPSTPQTRGLVSARVIAALPSTASVVNVGRADVLDTAALVAALTAGRLRGAVLDVHDEEPLPAASPLWDVPRLWITPHSAFRFPAEEHAVAQVFLAQLRSWRGGAPEPDAAARCPVIGAGAGRR